MEDRNRGLGVETRRKVELEVEINSTPCFMWFGVVTSERSPHSGADFQNFPGEFHLANLRFRRRLPAMAGGPWA